MKTKPFNKTTHLKYLKRIVKILKATGAEDFWDDSVSYTLEELGFQKSDRGSNGAWINQASGYVVKNPYICGFCDDDPLDYWEPTKAIPTGYIYDEDFGYLYVQPLADVSDEAVDRAYKEMQKDIKKTRNVEKRWGDDNHEGNIGIYRGEAVVFDW